MIRSRSVDVFLLAVFFPFPIFIFACSVLHFVFMYMCCLFVNGYVFMGGGIGGIVLGKQNVSPNILDTDAF